MHRVDQSVKMLAMHLSVEKAALAAGEGFTFGGVLGFVIASLGHPLKPLTTDRMSDIVGLAGYFALLCSLMALVFYVTSHAT